MNDIQNFKQLVKTIYPGFFVTVSIRLAENATDVATEEYTARLSGPGLDGEVKSTKHNPAAVLGELKILTAQSRRRHDTRMALDKIIRTYPDYTMEEREGMRDYLLACRDVPTFRNLVATYQSDANRKAYGAIVRPAA